MKVCLEFDDFGIDNHRLDLLWQLREYYDDFKVTMFAIPAHCPDDWVATLPDWIELCYHGQDHRPRECEHWTKDTALSYSMNATKPRFKRIFRAPYWLLSDAAYDELKRTGFKLCLHPDDKRESDYTYDWNGKDVPDLNKEQLKGHFHVQDVCHNGLEESFGRIRMLPKDTKFYFVSEAMDEGW